MRARLWTRTLHFSSFTVRIVQARPGISHSYSEFNFHPEPDNSYDADWIEELSTGDFDGDGLADVFGATGTGWYYSSAGESEWRFLRAASLRRDALAFADSLARSR